MARQISEIHNNIKSAFIAEPLIISIYSLDVNNTFDEQFSKVSFENIIFYIVSVAIWTLESLFDNHKAEVDNKILSLIPGTIRWYHSVCLMFQYGDTLTWLNDKFGYALIDAAKRIVKRVAIKEVAGQLRIKVCKETAGVPEALSTQELDSFRAFLAKVKFAGTNLAISSYGACLVKFTLNFTYDSLVLTNDGKLITDSTEVVNNAISDYLKNIVYGGSINRTKLIDAIQNVEGVVDVYIEIFEAKESGASVYTQIAAQNYEALSGYYILDSVTYNSTANV